MSTKHPKDMLDIEALKGKVDYSKIEELQKYRTTLRIVKPDIEKEKDDTLLESAIDATREGTTIKEINNQLQAIKSIAHSKEITEEHDIDSRE